MFAHQVIEDLKNINLPNEMKDLICAAIRNCQQFHMGEILNIWQFGQHLDGKPMFRGDLKQIGLPYKLTWFDFVEAEGGDVTKIAILVHEIEPNVFGTMYFIHSNRYNSWTLIPFKNIIDVNQEKIKIDIMPNFEKEEELKSELNGTETQYFLGLLQLSLLLLSCKNIGIEKVNPPESLNLKRKKRNKIPLFTYHILYLKPTTQHEKSIPKYLWENRIHLCRGHFKFYTTEHPLFGKLTGRYWWQAQARGNKKLGVVVKDYILKSDNKIAKGG